MSEFKTIIKGNLQFKNKRAYDQAFEMTMRRMETYYKGDVLLEVEETFNEEELRFYMPRVILYGGEKTWRNTIDCLNFIAQFAISGYFNAWKIQNKILLKYEFVEPIADKIAVQSYLKGRTLLEEEDALGAIRSLNIAIAKYGQHAPAFEQRAKVHFALNDFENAIADYTTSISHFDEAPEAYHGRAKIYILLEQYANAIADLEKAIKYSIPLQPFYWESRRLKGECLINNNQYQESLADLRFFTQHQFKAGNPNICFRKSALTNYGKALLETGQHIEALTAFNEAMKIEGDTDAASLLYRGIALKKSGKTGYKRDWKAAAKLGSKEAADLVGMKV